MFIVPKSGLKIRDPISRQFLPVEGREVPDHDLFWHRLLQDGDVVIGQKQYEEADQPAHDDQGGNQ